MPSQLTKKDLEKSLRLISMAWGRRQSGYVFFPYIDREAQRKSGKRRAGFNNGVAWEWPKNRKEIVDWLHDNQHHDVYWSTSIFEFPSRQEDLALDEHALWADLDEVDPRDIDSDYRPTVAWESSPGRYQCLWVAQTGNFSGVSDPGKENQRMTYMLGADASGWDAAQLLRIPGWTNHKPEYKDEKGNYPKGEILWFDGPRYDREEFAGLPEVQVGKDQLSDALTADIDGVDRLQVIADVKLKLNKTARDLLGAREVYGDRSDSLWYLIRCLADAGLTTAEIVAVVRPTPWNKFADRHDEMRRLIAEASKAIAKRSDDTIAKLEAEDAQEEEDEQVRPEPQRLGHLLKNIKKPKYIVQGILTEGACGFIAGEPKCYKSWVGLDLALSIATGADFLGNFRVANPGPVLYIQEEDPAPTLKNRTGKIWVNKAMDKIELVQSDDDEAGAYWLPPDQEQQFDPNINAYIQNGFIISNEAWQLWLDDTLAAGMIGADGSTMPYRLLIIDTLMMVAGDVDENRAQEMTEKVFKPLKVMSRKHNCAVLVIHHMGKADKARPGQRMLGSVANHAWGEDSLYLSRSGLKDVRIDTESKTVPAQTYRMTNIHNLDWTPRVEPWRDEEEEPKQKVYDGKTRQGNPDGRTVRGRKNASPILKALKDSKRPLTTAEIAEKAGVNRSTVHRAMMKFVERETVIMNHSESRASTWELVPEGA